MSDYLGKLIMGSMTYLKALQISVKFILQIASYIWRILKSFGTRCLSEEKKNPFNVALLLWI